ncbi:PspC domain-containing protein [Streptomyces bauhiniae]|uniref:PspC domain-containing protein n=1 Tax=Streptomyces bauhiniae TaxID=2340725 RepID=A0A7K3QT71_9ACTN|nr:PspC domain-containing protein [Streptomyces bauhiniae]NEB93088.1 PspC domain-containing protein [Streptomyces bauhiniae]
MTDHEHAATGPGPGTGPRPASGTGPPHAEPAATERTGPARADTTGTQETPAGAPGAERGGGGVRDTGEKEPGEREPGKTDNPAGHRTAEAPRRFRRDRRHKMIAGVCAGLGRHTDMDPVIFRITLAVLAATGGIGLIFYGFAWLLVPYDDEEENEVRKLLTGRVDGQALAAVLFALIGCGVILTTLRNGGVLTFAVVLSLLLAGAGYWSRHRATTDPGPSPSDEPKSPRGHPIAAQAAADAPPETQAPPIYYSGPSWWRDPIVKDGTHVGGTGYFWGPSDAYEQHVSPSPPIEFVMQLPWPHSLAGRISADRRPKPRAPRWISGWVFLLALLAGCLGGSRTWETRPLATSLQTGLACALVVFGLGIAVSAFLGRTGGGSAFLALVTALLLAGSAVLPSDVTSHWRQTAWRPAATADVRPVYELGSGSATLDLTRVQLTKDQTVSTRAGLGAGRLRVIVPADAAAALSIDVGVGDIRLPGDDTKDVDVRPGRHETANLMPDKGTKEAGVLRIDLHVGIGQVEVSRAAS